MDFEESEGNKLVLAQAGRGGGGGVEVRGWGGEQVWRLGSRAPALCCYSAHGYVRCERAFESGPGDSHLLPARAMAAWGTGSKPGHVWLLTIGSKATFAKAVGILRTRKLGPATKLAVCVEHTHRTVDQLLLCCLLQETCTKNCGKEGVKQKLPGQRGT